MSIEYVENCLFNNQILLIEWLFERNLLNGNAKCCDKVMNRILKNSIGDGFILRCTVCKKQRSIREGSFFSDSKLPLVCIIKIVLMWVDEELQCKVMEKVGVSKNCVKTWYNKLRYECLNYMEHVEPLGGRDAVVQIDETHLTKRKYNIGRVPCQKIVFGVIDTVTKDFIIRHIDNKTRETLRNVIVETIREESTVHSDQWSSYMALFPHENYIHSTVNHSRNFVNPDNGVNTNLIENLWMRLKTTLRRRHQHNFNNLDGYIAEFCFRKKYLSKRESIFEEIIERIKFH
jgi:transposase-like protein